MSKWKVRLIWIKHHLASFVMLCNWIPNMAYALPMPIAEMAKKASLAIMATIVKANVNFSMAKSGIQLMSITKLSQWCKIIIILNFCSGDDHRTIKFDFSTTI